MSRKQQAPTPDELDLFVRRTVEVDVTTLQAEFVQLPANLATMNARAAAAHERYLEADLAYDRTNAKLYIKWRAHLEAVEGRVSEGMIRAHVENDQEWVDARMARNEAEVDVTRAKGIVQAILAKRDVLMMLGAQLRAELQDPRTRQQALDAQHK